jgi:Fe-S cluster assembly protein SufD
VKMHLQHHILLEENSELTLVEEYISLNAEHYSNQIELEIITQKNARIHYHKIQNEDKSATHLANIQIKQSSGSEVNHFSLALGGRQARDDLSVEQNESASTCQLYGLYQLTEDHQQIEHHLYVDHMAELGQSKMLYKGIVDKKSKATFKGKVHVHKLAQKINAQQANHNLLLSNDSQVDSKPELEIYADEVKCTHGATIGQLDQEALFYLRSRGVDLASAKRLLLDAFADEVIRTIKNATIQQYIRGLI